MKFRFCTCLSIFFLTSCKPINKANENSESGANTEFVKTIDSTFLNLRKFENKPLENFDVCFTEVNQPAEILQKIEAINLDFSETEDTTFEKETTELAALISRSKVSCEKETFVAKTSSQNMGLVAGAIAKTLYKIAVKNSKGLLEFAFHFADGKVVKKVAKQTKGGKFLLEIGNHGIKCAIRAASLNLSSGPAICDSIDDGVEDFLRLQRGLKATGSALKPYQKIKQELFDLNANTVLKKGGNAYVKKLVADFELAAVHMAQTDFQGFLKEYASESARYFRNTQKNYLPGLSPQKSKVQLPELYKDFSNTLNTMLKNKSSAGYGGTDLEQVVRNSATVLEMTLESVPDELKIIRTSTNPAQVRQAMEDLEEALDAIKTYFGVGYMSSVFKSFLIASKVL